MAADILERIVADRRRRLDSADSGSCGYTQGLDLPAERPAALPVLSFPGPVICEIKRRSPSRGAIAAGLDPVERAESYRLAGATSVSVLTEEAYFSGSLADLVAVKRAFPDVAVLRKDFLLDERDVEVSWRAGADAILLIAAILDADQLDRLARKARELGLVALVEIHNREEMDKIRPLEPSLLGINSRDLRTFRVDLLEPLTLATEVDWPCRLVFESGIFHREDARLARDGGFSSVLVGEAVVREPERVGMLVEEMLSGDGRAGRAERPGKAGRLKRARGVPAAPADFWVSIARRRADRTGDTCGVVAAREVGRRRSLVKICGICNVEDALLARDLGADVLGMIYAKSPRTAPAGLARMIRDAGIDLPLVGVVLEGNRLLAGHTGYSGTVQDNEKLLAAAQADLKAGLLSALQLHGSSDPEDAATYGWPVYTAVRFTSIGEVSGVIKKIRTPRFLVDAYDPKAPGGTGRVVETEILRKVTEELQQRPHGALWLAGGLNPETIGPAVTAWQPELIDASSGLEQEPGRKDPRKLRRFFAAVDTAFETVTKRK